MKGIGSYFTGLFLSVLCLTSCLKGSNVRDDYACGVLAYSSKDYITPVMKTSMGDFSAPNLMALLNYPDMGDCFVFFFRLDYDLPENTPSAVEVNGYHTFSILNYAPIKKIYLNPFLTDINTMLPNEVPVLNGYNSGEYVNNHLFISQTVQQPSDLDLNWEMSYDESNMPTVEESSGKRYFDLYIRATVRREGEQTSKTEVQHLNAYHVGNYLSVAANMEKTNLGSAYNASTSKFYLRFNYVTRIDEETNAVTWQNFTEEIYIASFTMDQ